MIKYPNKSYLRKKGFILVHSSKEIQPITVGEDNSWEGRHDNESRRLAGYMAFTFRKQRTGSETRL